MKIKSNYKYFSTINNKVFQVLSLEHKKQLLFLTSLMIISMFLEIFSIASILPVINFLSQDDYATRFPILANFIVQIGSPSQEKLIIYSLVFFIFLYILKNIFLLFLAWKQSKFSSNVVANISIRLFKIYLFQPYIFHKENNSSELIKNTTSEALGFGTYGVMSSISLVSEGLVFLGIVSFLLYFEPVYTLSAIIILGITTIVLHLSTKKKLIKWGESRLYYGGKRIQDLQEALGGIKIIKLLNNENSFVKNYTKHTYGTANVAKKQSFITQVPRPIIEIVMIASMSALIINIIMTENSINNLGITLSIFAMSIFRLLPSINRIMFALQNLKFGEPIINLIYNDLTNLKKEKLLNIKNPISFDKQLSLNYICYKYPKNEKNSLTNISLEIKKGSTVGFIGESGSGKSTLIDIILGLLSPTSGTLSVDGKEIKNLQGWQKLIGYVPQDIYLMDNSLRKNIALGLKEEDIDDEKVWNVLEQAQLANFIKKDPKNINMFVGERGIKLSGGQKQRVGIARALYHNPEVLILDEATSALDNKTEKLFMETISKLSKEKTIIIVAHRLSTVENCDYLYHLKDGFIFEKGKPNELLQNKQ